MEWHPHDRDAAMAHRGYRAESCPDCGVHPSAWKPQLGGHRNAVVAKWVFCRVCELIGAASAAGPPVEPGEEGHGWRLTLVHTDPHS